MLNSLMVLAISHLPRQEATLKRKTEVEEQMQFVSALLQSIWVAAWAKQSWQNESVAGVAHRARSSQSGSASTPISI